MDDRNLYRYLLVKSSVSCCLGMMPLYSRSGAEELRLFVKTNVLALPACMVMMSSSHSSLIQQLGALSIGACGPPSPGEGHTP